MFEERRHEVVALESEFQHASIGHHGGGWGHPIDRVCRPLLGVRLGRRKDLALTTAGAASAADALLGKTPEAPEASLGSGFDLQDMDA